MRDRNGYTADPYLWAETATNEEIGGLIEALETDLAMERMQHATALAAARREALERAAARVDEIMSSVDPYRASILAAAIRALIETEASEDGGTERRTEGASGGTQSTPPTVPPSLRGVESPEAARPGAGSVATAQTTTDASTDSPAASPPPEPERCPRCGVTMETEVGLVRGGWRRKDPFHNTPPTGGKENP